MSPHLDVTTDELLWCCGGPVDTHIVADARSALGSRWQQRQPVAAGVVLPQAFLQGVEHRLQLQAHRSTPHTRMMRMHPPCSSQTAHSPQAYVLPLVWQTVDHTSVADAGTGLTPAPSRGFSDSPALQLGTAAAAGPPVGTPHPPAGSSASACTRSNSKQRGQHGTGQRTRCSMAHTLVPGSWLTGLTSAIEKHV